MGPSQAFIAFLDEQLLHRKKQKATKSYYRRQGGEEGVEFGVEVSLGCSDACDDVVRLCGYHE